MTGDCLRDFVYLRDRDVTLFNGDARRVLSHMADESMNCAVTSPPYYGLRDYGVDGQIGLEASPAEYVEQMRAVFADVRRVLAGDGVLWLNLGDSYHARTRTPDVGPKNLLGIPWRVAFALQDDGWTLRNAVIWHKPNAMPESVTDRLSTRYEHVFLFSKSKRYRFDLDPIREPLVYPDAADGSRVFGGRNKADGLQVGSAARRTGNTYGVRPDATNYPTGMRPQTARAATGKRHSRDYGHGGKNPGDVWAISTQPYRGAHFATMPAKLVRRCIEAGCPADGTVFDPFTGSGTTLMVARQLGRKSVGIELSSEYCSLVRGRIGPAR